jgi:hypothetical protein
MKNTLLLASTFLFTLSAMADVGFKSGNDFVSRKIVGQASVTCSGGPGGGSEFRMAYCEQEILDPNEFAYFSGHQGIDAEEVILHAIHEDGSTREKKEGFNSATGLSKDSFNLWIYTLLQRPLLEMGKNTVEYTLIKNGQSVVNGSFVANITRGETRECRQRGHYYSNNPSDCQFPEPVVCPRYFREQNYCE